MLFANSIRNSMHARTHGHMLTHVPATCIRTCPYIHVHKLWAQVCSLSLREPCFWELSADSVRSSMHTWHVLIRVLTTCFHMCVHTCTCAQVHTHTHRCRLHISRPCSHPYRSAPSPEGSPRLLPHPCPCLPCENLAQGKASIPSPAHSWDGPWRSLLL